MNSVLKRIQDKDSIVKPLGLLLIIAIIFAISIFPRRMTESLFENEIKVIINDTIELKTDISQTPNERAIGLSKYDELQSNEVMLFIFQEPGFYSFWMRNMKFPIDIIWLNEDKQIVSIKENADPSEYPQSYSSEFKSLYVLETVAGFVQDNNIQQGDLLQWEL